MSIFSRVVEKILDQADRDGTFDHLSGEGKPISWQDEAHIPEDQRLAYRLLRENGCRLPWLDEADALESDLITMRQKYYQAWTTADTPERREALREAWRQAVAEYNRRIFEYNLHVPLPRFQRLQIDAELEGGTIFTITHHTLNPQE